MSKKKNNTAATVVIAALAIAFGLLLGLAKAEDKNYSYKA